MVAPARRRSLLLRELGDETLAYDLSSHRASCLNREAAAVFHACDGRRSPQEIAAVVSAQLECEVGSDYVKLAIRRLAGCGLVDAETSPVSRSRREAIRRMAIATALALPIVTSVLAPEAAEAQTCLPNGKACTISGQCCSGCCGFFVMMCRNSGPFMIGCA